MSVENKHSTGTTIAAQPGLAPARVPEGVRAYGCETEQENSLEQSETT